MQTRTERGAAPGNARAGRFAPRRAGPPPSGHAEPGEAPLPLCCSERPNELLPQAAPGRECGQPASPLRGGRGGVPSTASALTGQHPRAVRARLRPGTQPPARAPRAAPGPVRGRRPHLAGRLPRPLRRHDPRIGGARPGGQKPPRGLAGPARSTPPQRFSAFRADARKCVTETRPARPASGRECARQGRLGFGSGPALRVFRPLQRQRAGHCRSAVGTLAGRGLAGGA